MRSTTCFATCWTRPAAASDGRRGMLTVQSLLDELGLDLAAGVQRGRVAGALGPHLRARGPDPVALRRGADADHRASRSTPPPSSAPSSAASPTTTSPGSASAPASATRSCRKRWSTRRRNGDFPLFEVPYSTPFIAITEKAFARLVNEQYEVLQRGIAVQRRLERLVLEERGLEEIVATISSAVGGTVAILGARGERLAGRGFRRELSAEAVAAIREEALAHTGDGHAFVPAHPAVAGRALAHPVISPGGGPPQAWVVIVRDSGGLGDFERLILQQAVAVVALELMRRRVARETERRLAGDVLAGALGGRLEPSELRRRLEPFGIGEEAAVLVFSLDDPSAAEPALGAGARRRRLPGGRRPPYQRRPRAALRRRRRRRPRPRRRRHRCPQGPGQRARRGPRGRQQARPRRSSCATPSTRRAAPLRRPPSTTASPGGRLLARPRRLHPAALDPGRRGAEALLRQRPRPDRGRRRGVRRRAAALAGGLHRTERPVGAGGPRGLLPPPHAALPDAQSRGADRPRPLPRPRPDRVLARPPRQGAGA